VVRSNREKREEEDDVEESVDLEYWLTKNLCPHEKALSADRAQTHQKL
jgi:hypothetical protein